MSEFESSEIVKDETGKQYQVIKINLLSLKKRAKLN